MRRITMFNGVSADGYWSNYWMKQPIGFGGLARIVRASPVPSVAIGGLKAEHVADVLAAGADGLAVVSAICGKPDPRSAAIAIAEAIAAARQEMRRAAEAGR